MEIERLTDLHQRYLAGLLTEQETGELELAIKDPENEQFFLGLMDATWYGIDMSQRRDMSVQKAEKIFKQVIAPPVKRKIELWPQIAAAVAIILMIGAGLFYYNNRRANSDQQIVYAGDVAPGKVGATLTLADGKKIKLTNAAKGELAKEAGITIKKTAAGQIVYSVSSLRGGTTKQSYNTLSTAKGETYILILPDQSKVWMNAGSSLTYATRLEKDGFRKVKLVGEAYFEVSKDKLHPFLVETRGQEVQVLGTHFNVNAYDDEAVIKTTLLEGSVKVSAQNDQKILVPGQQSRLNQGEITVGKADLEEVVSWKNGEIILNGQDVQTIMRMISRWYNVDVVYEGEIPKELYYAKISRFDNISKLLRLMEKAQGIHFKIEGRKVIVRK